MKSRNIYPICVALSEKNAEQTISLGRKFPFVEVRLDSGEYTEPEIKRIFKSLKNSIATCRPGKYDDAARLSFLSLALNTGAKFVDIEIESAAPLKKSLINLAKKRKARCIISYHNFKLTPGRQVLNKLIIKAKREGADIVKIATQIRDQKDAKVLMKLMAEHEKLVVIGMGEAGKSIRIAAPLLGSLFTFAAPAIGKETAPGQIEFSVLREMYSSLGLI